MIVPTDRTDLATAGLTIREASRLPADEDIVDQRLDGASVDHVIALFTVECIVEYELLCLDDLRQINLSKEELNRVARE